MDRGKKGKSPLFFHSEDFNLMERFSITLLYFCHTLDTLFPLCFIQDSSFSHRTHTHRTFSAHHWLRKVILSINQSSKSLGDEPIKWKVILSSFLSPPAPFPNSLFLIGTRLFSATVTKETSVTIATMYVKSVVLYLLKCSIYTCSVW